MLIDTAVITRDVIEAAFSLSVLVSLIASAFHKVGACQHVESDNIFLAW
jgi:hypothetical protein